MCGQTSGLSLWTLLLLSLSRRRRLRDCLPHLGFLIHDRSPKVRGEFVSLLLRVKHVRSIRFYNVVAIPDLLARLAHEASVGGAMTQTAAGLIDLLLNSYMP